MACPALRVGRLSTRSCCDLPMPDGRGNHGPCMSTRMSRGGCCFELRVPLNTLFFFRATACPALSTRGDMRHQILLHCELAALAKDRDSDMIPPALSGRSRNALGRSRLFLEHCFPRLTLWCRRCTLIGRATGCSALRARRCLREFTQQWIGLHSKHPTSA